MATPYPRKYRPILKAASQRYHIPARVLAAQEFVESGFSPDVISGRRKSSAGAYGISQFIASTGRQYGVRPGTSKAAVRTQVFGHAKYLHNLGASHNLRRAIASYAGGPGNPQYGYAAKVLGLAPQYRGVVRGVRAGRGGGSGGDSSQVVGGAPASSSRSAQRSGGTALAELTAKALQRQQGPPSFTLPAAPAFAAHVTLPEGQATGPPQSGLVVPQQSSPSLSELLQAAQSDANTVNARSTVANAVAGTRVGGGGAVRVDQHGRPHGTPHLKGVSSFEGHKVAAWIKPWLVYARKRGWKGTISSGYRSYADQARIYASGVRPAARPGTSNHEGANFPRGAVDVTDQYTLDHILRRAKAPLKFAGAKDPVHFSHPHNGGY